MTEIFGFRVGLGLMIATVIAGVTFLSETGWSANAGSAHSTATPIIMVDPGHGGLDLGASGDNGLLEKKVVLSIAETLGSLAGRGYQARLTRTGDYHVDLGRRTGIANNLKADLFISIHVGGSYLRRTRGSAVYYFDRGSQAETDSRDPVHTQGNAILWESVQERHQESSKQLAETMKKHLDAFSPQTEESCSVISAPMAVLAGADMPAVLIEIGYIRNPQDSKRFSEEGEIAEIAAAIADGIAEFLNRRQL